MYRAYSITQALYVVAKLGVADYLRAGPTGSDELGQKVGANPKALFRVMRHLATVGVFTQDHSRRFGLTPLGELLCSDHPESMRHGVIMNGEEIYRAAGELLHTVRTGETAFNHLYGKGHFEYLAEHPEASSTFNKAMAQSLRRQKNPIESYNFKDKRLVVDVGGGRGDMIASVLVANPAMRGILFDLPQGAAEAQSLLRAKGVEDRCQIKTGSFFHSIPAGADVYILSRILHDWPDEKASVIPSKLSQVYQEGGHPSNQRKRSPGTECGRESNRTRRDYASGDRRRRTNRIRMEEPTQICTVQSDEIPQEERRIRSDRSEVHLNGPGLLVA